MTTVALLGGGKLARAALTLLRAANVDVVARVRAAAQAQSLEAAGARIAPAREAVASADVVTHAQALATSIAANGPAAVRALKKNIGVDRAELQRALEREASAQADSYASSEFAEGLRAIAEKRKPKFQGK
jgi:1,4-dihydroxy-2-naphthoyl-CoA synthase